MLQHVPGHVFYVYEGSNVLLRALGGRHTEKSGEKLKNGDFLALSDPQISLKRVRNALNRAPTRHNT